MNVHVIIYVIYVHVIIYIQVFAPFHFFAPLLHMYLEKWQF